MMSANTDFPAVSGLGGRETRGDVYVGRDGAVEMTEAAARAASKPSTAAAETEPTEAERELDAEDVAIERNMLKLGMSPEEISRMRGRPLEQVGKPVVPVVTLASVERALREIRELRNSDARRYYSSDVQAEELRLIGLQQDLKEGKVPAVSEAGASATEEAEPSAADVKLAGLRAELAEVEGVMRNDRRRYDREFEARHRELLAEVEVRELGVYIGEDVAGEMREMWSTQGGVEARIGTLAGMVRSISGALSTEETAAFSSEFDALPAKVRVTILDHFSTDGGSLLARRAAIEKALAGTDLAAAQAFWRKWGDDIAKGLVR